MVVCFISLTVVYIIFLLFIIIFWERNDIDPIEGVKVSVISIVRNEEENLPLLLEDFKRQSYSKEEIEFIIVDDNSTDSTLHILKESCLRNLTILNLEQDKVSPKKSGIIKALVEAKGEYVIFTDGDCRVSPYWIENLVSYTFRNKYDFVCGPVLYKKGKSLLSRIQFVEMFSLIGVTGSTIRAGFPTMSNAANMIVKKSSFENIGGYGDQEHVVSGDDELLMHKLHKRGFSIGYLGNNDVIVRTNPNPNLKSLVNQRRRWGSKWRNYELPYIKVLALFVFMINLLVLIVGTLVFLRFFPLSTFVEMLFVKCVLEYFMMNHVSSSLDEERISSVSFLISFLIYPFYVVLIGVLSNIKGFEWKGRRY